jgi:hypothetical protein
MEVLRSKNISEKSEKSENYEFIIFQSKSNCPQVFEWEKIHLYSLSMLFGYS